MKKGTKFFQIIHQYVTTNLHFANALFTSSSPDKGSTSGWKTGRSKTKRCIRKQKFVMTTSILMLKPLGEGHSRCCFQILINCYCIKRKQPEVLYTNCETVTQHTHVTCRVLSSLTHLSPNQETNPANHTGTSANTGNIR